MAYIERYSCAYQCANIFITLLEEKARDTAGILAQIDMWEELF